MTAGIDRVHFLEEQRRNRRRSFRFSIFAVAAVGLAGIPLCVLASPLLLGAALAAAHLLDLIAPLSDAQWDRLHDLAFALPNLWARLRGRPVEVPWSTLAMLYIAPGALLMLLAWPFIQLLSRRAGAGMMLHRLASRDPSGAVLAEQQLANVVQEIAVAAGVRPLPVRIIESPAVNAVAIGLTTDDAVLLATTGFLDRLDRDERQAIVAHLVGSVANGDLEIAAVILSVFQTWGVLALLLERRSIRAGGRWCGDWSTSRSRRHGGGWTRRTRERCSTRSWAAARSSSTSSSPTSRRSIRPQWPTAATSCWSRYR